jgi:hypothetical protein
MDQANEMTLTFRCPADLDTVLPRPIPAVLGLPGWFKTMPQRAFNATAGEDSQTVKRCPPFVDAMTYGFLLPLPTDLRVAGGEFTWDLEIPEEFVGEYSHSPIDFYDLDQVDGTRSRDDDCFNITFNIFWTIKAPPDYSLLFTHPVNRADLPFTALSCLVDCDRLGDSPLKFPVRWHDTGFNGVLPKGTPIVQCMPVTRESWAGRFEGLTAAATARLIEIQEAIDRETDVYRRQFRASKR